MHKTTWLRRIVARIRNRPIVLVAAAIALVAGPYLAGMIFPEASTAKRLLGGWVFGAYLALCAVPEEFLEG